MLYAYYFFNFQTGLGPAELRAYIDQFRKSNRKLEAHSFQNYHRHTSAHLKRERSLLKTVDKIGSLFVSSDDAPPPPPVSDPAEC